MAAAGSLKIEIKKSFLTKSSGGKSFRGNFYWKSRFFKLEAEFPINSFPGPEHLSFLYAVSSSEQKEVNLQRCTPGDIQVLTNEDRKKKFKDPGIRKREHLFAVRSEEKRKGPRTYFLEAINDEEMTSWVCKLKEYLSRGELFAVFVEPNQGVQAGNVLLTFRDNCLVLLCCITNTVLGLWQLRKLASFGLTHCTLWFNTEKLLRARTPAAFNTLTLSDVEDYITLTVDTQYTGPTIVESLKRLLENNLKRDIDKSSGLHLAYSVRRRRYPSHGNPKPKPPPTLPKPLFERESSSLPPSPSLARKRMVCYDTAKDKVQRCPMTDLLISSQCLDEKVTPRRALMPPCTPKKRAPREVQSMPRMPKRKISQVHLSTTSKADTARFISTQRAKEFCSSDDEDRNGCQIGKDLQEIHSRTDVQQETSEPSLPVISNHGSVRSSTSSDEYMPMKIDTSYVNLTRYVNLSPSSPVMQEELSESSDGEEYVQMTAIQDRVQAKGGEEDNSNENVDHPYQNIDFGMLPGKQAPQEAG